MNDHQDVSDRSHWKGGETMQGDLSHVLKLADALDKDAHWIGRGRGMQSVMENMMASARAIRALFAAAPPALPVLSDERILSLWDDRDQLTPDADKIAFARAVLAAGKGEAC